MKLDVERGVTQHLGWGIAALGLGLMQLGLQGVRAAQAQILPHDPLNPEAAQVNAIAPGQTLIGGGALRGANLFHSFQDFNVGTGEVVLFADPGGIARIFSKVTGGNPSRIDGQFGVLDLATGNLSNADLFLLNPRGILLGPNAQSLVLGSLFLTTAEQVQFENYDFSAANPDLPPLLNIGVPIGLQMGAMPGAIVQESPNLGAGLTVAPQRTLALVGGDIQLSGAAFFSLANGRFELGAVGANERVTLLPNDRGYALDYTAIDSFQNIQLINTVVDDAAMNGLVTQFQARTIRLEDAEFSISTVADQSDSNMILRAIDSIVLTGSVVGSFLYSVVLSNATGAGSDISITTPKLIIDSGSQLGTLTEGLGKAGDLIIKTSESLEIAGSDSMQTVSSSLFSTVQPEASGAGGNIFVETPTLLLGVDGQLATGTFGFGDAGNITIQGNAINGGTVETATTTISLLASRLFSFSYGAGNAGDLFLKADQLHLENGGQIGSATFAAGDTGRLEVQARTVDIHGTEPADIPMAPGQTLASGLYVTVEPGASGKGDRLVLDAQRITIADGGVIQATTTGSGQAASLEISASDSIVVTGQNTENGKSSALFSSTKRSLFAQPTDILGDGGDIELKTPLLRLENGALLTAKSEGAGQAGDINLDVARLEVLNGAQILASTSGQGDSGLVKIFASEGITISGQDADYEAKRIRFDQPESFFPESAESAIAARSFGSGAARQIQLQTPQLRVQDGGLVTVSSQSSAAGNLDITAQQVLLDRGFLQANTQSGEQGSINLRGVDVLTLRRRGAITANAAATSTGGNLDIAARLILAIPNENSDITANALQGQGGRIAIQTQGLFGIELRDRPTPQSDITASSEVGLNGTVQIDQLAADPSQGLTELPTGLLDEVQQITNACDGLRKAPQDRLAQSRFIRTGRGGLPPDPRQTLWPNPMLSDWREQPQAPVPPPSPNKSQRLPQRPTAPAARVESQGIQVDADGTVHLVVRLPSWAEAIAPGQILSQPAAPAAVNRPDDWSKLVQNSSKMCW